MARDPGEDCAVEIRDKVMQLASIQEIKLKVGMYYIVTSARVTAVFILYWLSDIYLQSLYYTGRKTKGSL